MKKLKTVTCSVLHNQRGYFEPLCILPWIFMPLDSPMRFTPDVTLQPIATRKFY